MTHDHQQHAHADPPHAEPSEQQHAHGEHADMPMSPAEMASHPAHGAHVDHSGHEQLFRRRFWVCLVLSIPVLVLSPALQEWLHFSVPAFAGSEWVVTVFAITIFLYGGVPFLQMAVPEIQNRQPGMMTLISLAISVAFIYSLATLFVSVGMGFFWELVTLIDVMLLGHWLEMRSVRQASSALEELTKLLPDTAELSRADGSTETVAVSQLRVNDRVLVRPGAKIPADGQVEEGQSDVNEALITGESQPVSKQRGNKVIAGSINGDGSLRVRVTATGDETALAGIMRLVQQAQQSKSRTQVLADRAAGWLFYAALAVAALTAVAWTVAVGLNAQVVERVATVLVIACPHALGLAVPLVVAITTSLSARNGILIRDRRALEEAREITMVVFDKTGTLTQGEQGVVGIVTDADVDQNEALTIAAAVEGDSEHVVSRAIRQAAHARRLRPSAPANFEALKGRGVRATVDGHEYYVGGPRLLELLNVQPPGSLKRFSDESGARGQSVVFLVEHQRALAAFALADVIRPESKPAVEQLHARGI
ncbi:MAG: heavy metal translocating P-type ATPase, partial [Chloroflexi bacterium]